MADLDSLDYTSISDLSNDEALERLRQIRLSRRTPVKTTKTITKKSVSTSKTVTADQAAELLKLIMGDRK